MPWLLYILGVIAYWLAWRTRLVWIAVAGMVLIFVGGVIHTGGNL